MDISENLLIKLLSESIEEFRDVRPVFVAKRRMFVSMIDKVNDLKERYGFFSTARIDLDKKIIVVDSSELELVAYLPYVMKEIRGNSDLNNFFYVYIRVKEFESNSDVEVVSLVGIACFIDHFLEFNAEVGYDLKVLDSQLVGVFKNNRRI